jgi:hypothetical protein
VLAAEAPKLREALERAKDAGFSHVILDAKIIVCDQCKKPALSVKGEVIDLWYSGKAWARPNAGKLAGNQALRGAHRQLAGHACGRVAFAGFGEGDGSFQLAGLGARAAPDQQAPDLVEGFV